MHVLDSLVNYNKAQFALFVALGQPPPKFLAKAVPENLVPRPQPAPPLPACVGPNGAGCIPPKGVSPALLPNPVEGPRPTTPGGDGKTSASATPQAATLRANGQNSDRGASAP
jgi:hypothetical protein